METRKAIDRVGDIINFFKKNWVLAFFYLISTSIVLLFSCSLIFKENIELQTINNWIGIILGLVATIASIISLYLSFYNLEREQEENRENNKLLIDLRETIVELKKSQIEINSKLEKQAEMTDKTNEMLKNMGAKPTRINKENMGNEYNEYIRMLYNKLNNEE